MPVLSTFTLGVGERIRQVQVRYDVWMDRVVLETSEGRTCEMGRGESGQWPQTREWTVGNRKCRLLLPEGDGKEYEVLAYQYGCGGHLHNMALHYHEVH